MKVINTFVFYVIILFNLNSQEISLAFTSNLNGEIFGCNCPGESKPGLSKIAYELKKLKKNSDLLLFDTGDLTPAFKSTYLSTLILNLYKKFGYDLIGIGDQEILNNIEKIEQNNIKEMLISSNLYYNELNLFHKYRIFVKNNLKIGVISLIDKKTLTFIKDYDRNIIITDYEPELKESLSILKDNSCDLVILLSHLGYRNDIKIAENYEDVNVIISGHDQNYFEEIKFINKTVIAASGNNGHKIGILKIKKKKSDFDYKLSFIDVDYHKTKNNEEILQIITDIKYNNNVNFKF